MKWKALVVITFFILQSATPAFIEGEKSRYRYTTHYIFENRGEKTYVLSEEEATVPLFWDNKWQIIEISNYSSPVRDIGEDSDGNPIGLVELPLSIEPNSNVSFFLTYEIESREKPRKTVSLEGSSGRDDIPDYLIREYCVATETFMSDDRMIMKMANSLAGNEESVLVCVLNLLDWFINNASYANYEVPQYPNETLASRTGDCDDQAILLISMLRSLDIPAFLQVGIVIHDRIHGSKKSWNGHLDITQEGVGWHGWAMVFIPPWGWIPIDLTLNQREEAIKLINDSPEFNDYIIPVLNISRQAYVGDTLETREAIINSELYITIVDEGERISDGGYVLPDMKMIILATLLFISITSLFILSRRN